MARSTDVTINLSGIFLPLLTLVFVIGKVFGYLTWSWWFVFAPLLVPAAIVVTVITCIGVFALGALILSKIFFQKG